MRIISLQVLRHSEIHFIVQINHTLLKLNVLALETTAFYGGDESLLNKSNCLFVKSNLSLTFLFVAKKSPNTRRYTKTRHLEE